MKQFYTWVVLALWASSSYAGGQMSALEEKQRDSLLAVVQHSGSGRAQVRALLRLSNLYRQADSARTRRYAMQALAVAQQQRLDTLAAAATREIARAVFAHSQYGLAKVYYARAFRLYRSLGLRNELSNCQRGIGNSYFYLSERQPALRAYQAALTLARAAGNKEDQIEAHNGIGNTFLVETQYRQALPHFLTGLRLAERYRVTASIAHLLNNIGVVYEEQDDHEQALHYYRRALHLFRQAHNQPKELLVLGNLGVVYLSAKNYPLAERHLLAALALQQRMGGELRQKHKLLVALGKTVMERGDNRRALRYLQQDEALLNQLNQRRELFYTLLHTAEAYRNLGQYPIGMRAARAALAHAQQYKAPPALLAMSYDMLAKLNAAQGRYEAAYHCRELYVAQQDSALRQQRAQQTAELLARYETEKKEAQIQLLRRNAALHRRELLWQNRFRNALGGGLLVAVLLGGSWYRRFRRERQAKRLLQIRESELAAANEDLTHTQQELRQSLSEKEVLLREVHHRVKNNLQIIASLFSLQARRQASPAVAAVLREGQNWVRSIALTHEMLYRAADLTHVDFQSLLEQITRSLQRPLPPAGPVHCTIRAEGVRLNASTAVPLALLINELVTNAYAHAFPDGQAGTVGIDLRADAPGRYTLLVADDGLGLPPHLNWQQPSSLGLRLVQSLARQLQGVLQVRSSATDGTCFALAFAEVVESPLPA